MVLNQISACKGNPGDMIENTLNLGIAILRGGNLDAQTVSLTLKREENKLGSNPQTPDPKSTDEPLAYHYHHHGLASSLFPNHSTYL